MAALHVVPAAPQCVAGNAELALPHNLPAHRLRATAALCCFFKMYHPKKPGSFPQGQRCSRLQPLKSRCSSHPCLEQQQQQNCFHTKAREPKPSAENSFFQNYGGARPCSFMLFPRSSTTVYLNCSLKHRSRPALQLGL